jgi:hypothetical protein
MITAGTDTLVGFLGHSPEIAIEFRPELPSVDLNWPVSVLNNVDIVLSVPSGDCSPDPTFPYCNLIRANHGWHENGRMILYIRISSLILP